MSYPEHEKLQAVADESQAIGEFLEGSRFTLCELKHFYGDRCSDEPVMRDGREVSRPKYEATGLTIQAVLADWFDIDLAKLEAEKRSMLDQIRATT